jgi:hypothetical protein
MPETSTDEQDAQVRPRQRQKPGEPQKVIVTNIKMSFGAMVVFMIKWVLAAIPAFIILALIFGILSLIFGALVTGCVTGMRST